MLVQSINFTPINSNDENKEKITSKIQIVQKFIFNFSKATVGITIITASVMCIPNPLHAFLISSLALYILFKGSEMSMHWIKSILAEIGSVIVMTLSYPCLGTFFDPVQKSDKGIDVIFIHGFLHNSSGWHLKRKRLQAAGFNSIYTINLSHPGNSIEDFSEELRGKIDSLGIKECVLIGHSMGGLVAAHYASKDSRKVKKVITLGSPLQGTKTAFLGIGKCMREMQFQSQFTQDLIKNMAKANITFHHLGSKTDLVVMPKTAAFVSNPNSKNYQFDSCGHLQFFLSKEVTDLVIRILKE